jgi:hypothetical protein
MAKETARKTAKKDLVINLRLSVLLPVHNTDEVIESADAPDDESDNSEPRTSAEVSIDPVTTPESQDHKRGELDAHGSIDPKYNIPRIPFGRFSHQAISSRLS